MGATNTTTYYNLSQFVGTDKPAWLQDYNGDMLKIDTAINAAKVAADSATLDASAAQLDASTALGDITNTITPAITSLQTTVGNQGGAINTINSLIGNGTPTTTDQTIIGAINEINGELPSLTTNTSDSHVEVDYYKIKDVKIVSLSIHNLDKAADTPIFTLPAGFRPSAELTRFFYASVNSSPSAVAVKIKTSGEIVPNSTWNSVYGNITVVFA